MKCLMLNVCKLFLKSVFVNRHENFEGVFLKNNQIRHIDEQN